MTFSRKKWTVGDVINITFLILISLICILPILYIASISLTASEVYVPFQFYLIPKKVSLESYKFLLSSSSFITAALNTVKVTAIGTVICLFTTFTTAYAMTKPEVPGHKIFMAIIIFTLIFNAGLIPVFLSIKNMGLINSHWSIILPFATNSWNLLVVRSFMQSIPSELEDSARMDGCNDLQVFTRIILPLSFSSLASFTLFFAVLHWNNYFAPMMYLTNSNKWTLQLLIKSMVIDNSSSNAGIAIAGMDQAALPQEPIRYASVLLSVIPILVVYPFLQKYFVKGMMIGAVKG